MKSQQTPLNTKQPDTADVQAAIDRGKARTLKLHGEVQEIISKRPAPAQAQHSLFPNLEARKTPELVPDLPWFVSHDEAQDCRPHTNSGLAKIDTGRESDWPVARLLEWPTAYFIVRACNNAQRLADALDGLLKAYMYIPDREIGCHLAHRYDKARETLAQWEGTK